MYSALKKPDASCFNQAAQPGVNISNGPTSTPVKFNIKPEGKCLFDMPVHVQVEGLRPKQQVIFRATLTDEKQDKFVSRAHFEADTRGVLDLTKCAALGGDYVGVHPMGFMWAMKLQTDLGRLFRKDVTSPFKVHLSVHEKTLSDSEEAVIQEKTLSDSEEAVIQEKTLSDSDEPVIASCIHERGFIGDGVQRIPVREGRIRATLFLPPAAQPGVNISNGPTSTPVKFNIKPEGKCLFDMPVHVQVEGLRPKQQVIFRATLTDEKQDKFVSRAHFEADTRGVLDLTKCAALGGDYVGVHPMGFMWAMKLQTDLGRLFRKDVTSPFKVHLSVHEKTLSDSEEAVIQEKTLSDSDEPVIASCIHERGFIGDGVPRIPVREGRIRATLFLPPGEGPFPGVVELGGTAGGLLEYRASLLANHGFATLCLAYFAYDDLPKKLLELHLEYFEEALQYFQNLPQVKKGGVGIMAISKGADLSLSMASFLEGVSAVVSVNGFNANTAWPLHYRGMSMPALVTTSDGTVVRDNGVLNVRDSCPDPRAPENAACLVPIERATARFLFVASQDDQAWYSERYARQAEEQLLAHGRPRPEILLLPGAGHLLEPPFFPCCSASYHKSYGLSFEWGGQPESHNAAQEKYWRRAREFLWENLGGPVHSKI